MPFSRSLLFVFGALMLVALFVYLWNFDAFQFGWNPDSGDYTLLSHALVTGPAYALNYNDTLPESSQFPFGYPLLILPFVLFAPADFLLPAWLSLAATLLNGALLFWGWHTIAPGFSDRWRIAVTAMYLLAPTTVAHSRQVLSEAVFTTFLLVAILLAIRLLANPHSLRLWFAFSISAFFMIFTRSIGLVCFAGFAVLFLVAFLREASIRRAFLRGTALVITVFLVLPGILFALTPLKPSDLVPNRYLDLYGITSPGGIADRITANLPRNPGATSNATAAPTEKIPDDIPRALRVNPKAIGEHVHRDLRRMITLTGGGDTEIALAARLKMPWLLALPGLIGMVLLALGNASWWHHTRRRTGITVFQAIGLVYFAVALLWIGGGDRLFYPIQPQLYFAVLLGAYTSGQLLLRAGGRLLPFLTGPRVRQFALGGLALLVGSWLVLALYRDLTMNTSYQAWGNLDRRTDWIARNLPSDAVVLSDWPVRDYLVTGRQMVKLPGTTQNADQLVAFLKQHHITHIILALDASLQQTGITPNERGISNVSDALRKLKTQGKLVPVHSDPFPVLVFQVIP